MISMLLDESILIREYRRWKSQRRWKLMLAACAPGAYVAIWVLLSLMGRMGQQVSSPNLLRSSIGVLGVTVMLSSFFLAFFQSMQVLRREAWTQTLDGLFLTRQKNRAVMLSVALCGIAAGAAVSAVFLPVIVLAAAASWVSVTAVIAYALLDAGLILVGASLGSIWFFANHHGYDMKLTPARVALNVLALAAMFVFAWYHSAGRGGLSTAVELFESLFLLYAIAGVGVWCARTLLHEARELARPGHADDDGIPQRGLSKFLISTALLFSSLGVVGSLFIVTDAPSGALDVGNPLSVGSWFWPFSAAMDLFRLPVDTQEPIGRTLSAVPAISTMGIERALVLAAIEFLLSVGIITCACRLYRQMRARPESSIVSRPDQLNLVAVGRDDWRGFGNPILTRELRTRLRSGDARMFINIAAIVSAAAALGPVLTSLGDSISPTMVAAMARDSFVAVSLVQLAIVCLVGPGIGAEVIAAEREHKTYEMLLASRLSASEILWGKVQGCVALLLLLISPALPLLALAAYMHGVTAASVLLMIGGLGLFVLIIALMSVSISALSRTSITGKWTAYLLAGLLAACTWWVPFTLASGSSGLFPASIYLFVVANVVTLLWFAALNRVQGRRLPPREGFVPPVRTEFTSTRVH